MNTKEPERISFQTSDGAFDAMLFRSRAASAPGLLILPEVFGRSPAIQDMARAFAESGFLVGLIDLYWRQEAEVALELAQVERARALHQRLDYDKAAADIGVAVEAFRAAPGCSGRVGLVGYCLGGTLAFMAAARTLADAAVSYYGTRIPKYIGDTPRIQRPLLMHLGGADSFTPPEVIAQIEQATAGNPLVERFVYPGVGHSFCNPIQPHYDAAAASLANRRSREFLNKHLAG